jgi:glyoxylase-like metal-dependent hydrolase (beta-lactamase superfamily II)
MLTVTTLDTGLLKPGFAASFLLHTVDGPASTSGYALVDVGSSKDAPRLVDALLAHQVPLAQVQWVFVTHVHLDHAGGVGLLLRDFLPQARVVVHRQGVAHLRDPSRLEAGARSVYGDHEFDRLFGSLVAVPPERLLAVDEGDSVPFADAKILDTPGHARHHYALWFARERVVFTGDTFGLAYPSLSTAKGPFLYPTTTPTAFEPEKLLESQARLAALEPRFAYLTHFGALEHPAQHLESLARRVRDLCRLATVEGASLAVMERHFANEYAQHGGDIALGLDWMSLDLPLNAKGLEHWLARGGRWFHE